MQKRNKEEITEEFIRLLITTEYKQCEIADALGVTSSYLSSIKKQKGFLKRYNDTYREIYEENKSKGEIEDVKRE